MLSRCPSAAWLNVVPLSLLTRMLPSGTTRDPLEYSHLLRSFFPAPVYDGEAGRRPASGKPTPSGITRCFPENSLTPPPSADLCSPALSRSEEHTSELQSLTNLVC